MKTTAGSIGNLREAKVADAGVGGARIDLVIGVILVVLTVAVFGQTAGFPFVNFDDNLYVYNNSEVTRGLTAQGVVDAFKRGSSENWDPLTTLSHMLDCQIYGLRAGGHHLTNVLLHTASVILLFVLLRRMTGARWRSAFVAAVFAIHPLHVESVAWVSERKDVLSGLFFMLTIAAYLDYVRRPRLIAYVLVMVLFLFGLMSKAMLVTLPFVLLLLDYWPLRRFRPATVSDQSEASTNQKSGLPAAWRLIAEKLPLLVVAAGFAGLAIFMQKRGNAFQTLTDIPLHLRLENMPDSVVAYLGQMFYPSGLAVFYPFPVSGLPSWQIGCAVLVCVALTVAVWRWRKEHPYLLAGWLWNLVMLLPVIGLIQVGQQARADRYTYLPQIGLYVALTWLVADWSRHLRRRRELLWTLGIAVVAALSIGAFIQTTYWRDSVRLWTRDLACATDNELARYAYGLALADRNEKPEALIQFQRAVELAPGFLDARDAYGGALADAGRLDEAVTQLKLVLAANPSYVLADTRLGAVLYQEKQTNEAIAHYETALRLEPWNADTENLLGYMLFRAGRVDEAIARLQHGVKLQPDRLNARFTLATALFQKGRLDEAVEQFQATLRIQPGFGLAQTALGNIAWRLATSPDDSVRNGARALELAQELVQQTKGSQPAFLPVLAAALAETGRFPEAVAAAGQALQLAQQAGDTALTSQLQEQLQSYRNNHPFREPAAPQPSAPN